MKRLIAAGIILLSFATSASGQGLEIFRSLQDLIIGISETVKPTVVHIEVVKKVNNQRFQSLGSGIIVSPDGLILTNEHVVDKQVKVTVTLESKIEYPAEVIGTDKLTDLALLRIDVPEGVKLQSARLGDSDSVKVGQWVLAVGNPYGFDRTVSFGIVSGKGRVLNLPDNSTLLNDFIQTDAAIDPGSSGGPLVNLQGEVIGINSIGVGRMQGFTIPVNIAIDVKNKLLATGTIERGYIGIATQPLNRSYARFLGQPDLQGILVADVYPGQAADKAEIKPGDVILEFAGKPVYAETEDDLNKFALEVAQSKVGERVPFKIMRNKQYISGKIVIGQKPKVKADEFETDYDFTVKEITDEMFRQFLLQTKEGVFVQFVEVGSAGDKGGLESGDVIVAVNGEEVKNLDDFKADLRKIEKPDYLLLRIMRGKDYAYALLDFTETKPGTAKKSATPESH